MPHYRPDPLDPTKHISAIDLLRRNPNEAPPADPRILGELLKADTWTRRAALLILAGYDPRTETDSAGHPIGPRGSGPVYVDGTTWAECRNAGISNPRETDALHEYMTLCGYAAGGDPTERRTPTEWLEWAEGKGFTPYWTAKEQSANNPDAEAARRAEGRYTLREAAKEIARQGRADWREIAGRLKADWASGKLPVFGPGSTVTCTPSSAGLHPDYLEVNAAALNAWLGENEPAFLWRFPRPETAATPSEPDADGGTARQDEDPQHAGVPLQSIKAAPWPLPFRYAKKSFHRDLSDPPKWMQGARMSRGSSGRGRQSSTWNPALLAECLATKKSANRGLLAQFIKLSFPAYLAQWDDAQDWN